MTLLAAAVLLLVGVAELSATQPPRPGDIERFRADGSLQRRIEAVRRTGNHLLSPAVGPRLGSAGRGQRSTSSDGRKLLPSRGVQRVFALLIEFTDFAGGNPAHAIDRRLFGAGPAAEFPYESLRDYYLRSSYGALELEGVTLGWYRTAYPQSRVPQDDAGREGLISEAIDHFDAAGHDFSRYDNDGDGEIDYFLVFYAGEHQEWGDFWWGYQRSWVDGSYTVDGLTLGAYSWQWESWEPGGPFSARVAIHETGHALGLPDYYDYDDEIGPRGGLGGLDMMDNNWGDHNAFSKWVLGWLEPRVVNEGLHELELRPSSEVGDAAVAMHGHPLTDPYAEYFIIQNRRPTGNDVDYPSDGLLIWHIDARVDADGRFLFDNSYTVHKLIRLMEADGIEEIEQGYGADGSDFYTPGDELGVSTTPSSHRYDGLSTDIELSSIERGVAVVEFDLDLGAGCGVFADVEDPVTGWPAVTTPFRANVDFANCEQPGSIEWSYGDGERGAGSVADHAYRDEGSYAWGLDVSHGDAELRIEGTVRVCDDPGCSQWRPETPMSGRRLQHAAVALDDGRVLGVGGGPPPEIFDPASRGWTPAARHRGVFSFASAQRLPDGRVLVTGSSPGSDVSAEIYDPVADEWEPAAPMLFDRVMHSSIRLPDGRVLVAGGLYGGSGVSDTEIFDPSTGTWAGAGAIAPVEIPGLAILDDGDVLFVGRRTTRIFDPDRGKWRRLSDLAVDHRYGATVKLDDGRVMVIGGEGTYVTEIYDPELNLWLLHRNLGGVRAVPSAVVLETGQVLAIGGADRRWNVGSRVEVFDPTTDRWSEAQPMSGVRLAHTATVLPDGSVLVTGGTTSVLSEPYVGQSSVERFVAPVVTEAPRDAARRIAP